MNTAYVNTLIKTSDHWHARAVRWERKLATERRRLLTTQFVLIEIGDCTSFVVMREHQLSEALTADDDFIQAGLRALMLEEVA